MKIPLRNTTAPLKSTDWYELIFQLMFNWCKYFLYFPNIKTKMSINKDMPIFCIPLSQYRQWNCLDCLLSISIDKVNQSIFNCFRFCLSAAETHSVPQLIYFPFPCYSDFPKESIKILMALAPQVEFLSLIRSIKELVKNVRVIFIFMYENSSIKRSRWIS